MGDDSTSKDEVLAEVAPQAVQNAPIYGALVLAAQALGVTVPFLLQTGDASMVSIAWLTLFGNLVAARKAEEIDGAVWAGVQRMVGDAEQRAQAELAGLQAQLEHLSGSQREQIAALVRLYFETHDEEHLGNLRAAMSSAAAADVDAAERKIVIARLQSMGAAHARLLRSIVDHAPLHERTVTGDYPVFRVSLWAREEVPDGEIRDSLFLALQSAGFFEVRGELPAFRSPSSITVLAQITRLGRVACELLRAPPPDTVA